MSSAASFAIKPGISAQGFRVAVRDYTEKHVVEELAANSYDADANTVLVLLDGDYLHIVDDGLGFNLESIRQIAVLGAGDKTGYEYSRGKRPYLGCYGFGLKSTLNIARKVEILTSSKDGSFSVSLDWTQLEQGLKGDSSGFNVRAIPKRGKSTGTHIILTLKSPVSSEQVDQYASVLSNLPEDEGRFKAYCGLSSNTRKHIPTLPDNFADLKRNCLKLTKRGSLLLADASVHADLRECEQETIRDKEDKDVAALFHFGGLENAKVRPIKKGLRGIYVRINGRLLKQSFDDQRFVYNISKWVKFAAGLRVEISIDWLRNEISLSREGVRFSNPKLEENFRGVLTRLISRFIQPKLKALEKKSLRDAGRKYNQRVELARKRVQDHKSVKLPGDGNGFSFKPETDGELALVLAQKNILKQVNSGYQLIDYNDQAPFDCMLYDSARREFIQAELEPTLIEFLSHREVKDVQLIVTWTTGKWRIGAKKKGKGGVYQLNTESGGQPGRYRLLVFGSFDAKKPRSHYPVIALEEVLS